MPERTIRNYCAIGKIKGSFLTGKTWNIPEDATLPVKGNKKKFSNNALLNHLKEQKEMRLRGGIYHRTQIDLTYNSNRIEGSKLTHDQTRYIFETNTIGFNVGKYKKLPSEVGGNETCPPSEVTTKMKDLLSNYHSIEKKTFEDIKLFDYRGLHMYLKTYP